MGITVTATDIALWLSALVFGIGVALTIHAWQIKAQNDDLKRENERLKMEKTEAINEPRDISADKHLIQLAKDYKGVSEVRVIGINSLGLVHQAREDIMELLNAGKAIKFLLLNPKSEEFIDRIKVECKPHEDFESHKQRLIAEWNATIKILRSITRNVKNKNLLEVRVRNEKPSYAFSATISQKEEECFAWINEYPPEGRGTRGKQFLCRKSIPAEKRTYETYIAMYETSWGKATPISIDDDEWIL